MATTKSRRRSLFDSDEEAEIAALAENPPVSVTISASTSSTSLNGGNLEENAVHRDQRRSSKLEHRNSRTLFSSDEEDDAERPRASSNTTHRKTVLFDSDDDVWFRPSSLQSAAAPTSLRDTGEPDDWKRKYEEERRRRLELERELAECQEKLAAFQTYAAAMETWVPEETLSQLAQQKQQEMSGQTQDDEEFDKEWQAMAQAEAERRAKKRQQRRARAGNSTRLNLRQARTSNRKAALTPPPAPAPATSVSPQPSADQPRAKVSAVVPPTQAQPERPSVATIRSSSSSSATTITTTTGAAPSTRPSKHETDNDWDSSGSEGWSDAEPRPSFIEQPGPNRPAETQPLPRQALEPALPTVDVEKVVLRWAQHSNIVAMLMTVQHVFGGPLPPLPTWEHRPSPDDVRRAYLRVVRYCHPDKVAALGVSNFNGSQAAYQLAITQSKLVFGALTDAYSMYKQLNGL